MIYKDFMTENLKRNERERKRKQKRKSLNKKMKKREKGNYDEYRNTSDNVRMNKSESA